MSPSSVWADASVEERNLTGFPEVPGVLSHGPLSLFIANYSQAECFCVDALTEFPPCKKCWSSETRGEFGLDDRDNTRHIESDCKEFGYYTATNLTYPSTTLLSSVPFETEFPSDDEGDALCGGTCGPLRTHIEVCDLTSIDVGEWPEDTEIAENEYSYELMAAFLLNRTAAECLCTLKVLRGTVGCGRCLSVKEEYNAVPNLRMRVDNYDKECHEYGYWTDSEWIIPSFDEFYDDETTSSLTSPGHSPTPTDESGVGRSLFSSIGLIASSLFTGLIFLF